MSQIYLGSTGRFIDSDIEVPYEMKLKVQLGWFREILCYQDEKVRTVAGSPRKIEMEVSPDSFFVCERQNIQITSLPCGEEELDGIPHIVREGMIGLVFLSVMNGREWAGEREPDCPDKKDYRAVYLDYIYHTLLLCGKTDAASELLEFIETEEANRYKLVGLPPHCFKLLVQ